MLNLEDCYKDVEKYAELLGPEAAVQFVVGVYLANELRDLRAELADGLPIMFHESANTVVVEQ